MDLRLGRSGTPGAHWTVMTDVAIAMFLVLILYIVVQFLRDFEDRYINEQLALRQDSVESRVREGVGGEYAHRIAFHSESPDHQRITFSSDVLFAECRDDLRPTGRQLLAGVGQALAEVQGFFRAIQVDGHTDIRPIAVFGNCPYPSNWELSSARATTVVRLFSDTSKIGSTKLSAVGWAEFQPVDSTALDPNRRIEVSLLYDREAIRERLKRRDGSGS